MDFGDVRYIRESLRALPKPTIPAKTSGQLLVVASREAARRRRRASLPTFVKDLWSGVSLWFDNLMRPVALPFAGGLVSALLLFAALAPSLTVQRVVTGDVPTGLSTTATLESSISYNLSDSEIAIDVVIDEHGRVVDYTIPPGEDWARNPDLVRNIENTLLLTKFVPATLFGQPAATKARITLRRSQMEVRG